MGLNRTDFPTRLTLELSGARFCASDLNAKLDLGDEPEECHGLMTGASHEKTLRHRNEKKLQTSKPLQAKPMETAKQALQNA